MSHADEMTNSSTDVICILKIDTKRMINSAVP